MAGMYGSNSVTLAYDDGPGGTARTITARITAIGGIKIAAIQDDVTAYGDTIMKALPTGMKELPDIDLEYLIDTTSNSTYDVFDTPDTDPNGTTRTLTIVIGDSKTWQTEGYLKEAEVLTVVGKITRGKAKLSQVSGGWQ